MTRSIDDLRNTPDAVLIREHDVHAQHTVVGTHYYIEELERRSRDRATAASLELARRAYWMTVASTAFALLAVGAAIIALYS